MATDIVGEKLAEDFVGDALSRLGGGACLAARATATPFYELLIDVPASADLSPYAALIEERLNVNPQYAYARALGQLGPVKPRAVERLLHRYTDVQARRGCRLADIKPPVLIGEEAYAALVGGEVTPTLRSVTPTPTLPLSGGGGAACSRRERGTSDKALCR